MMENALNLLVVEDSSDIRRFLELAFTSCGHRVTLCENGAQAVQLCCKQGALFDLIFMDLRMPVLDGVSAAKALRACPVSRHTSIIGISAYFDDPSQAADGFHVFDRCVLKPFSFKDLLDIAQGVLKNQKAG
jgi:CheY-like chemotaxis protein